MELVRTFLAVPPDEALRGQLVTLFSGFPAAGESGRDCTRRGLAPAERALTHIGAREAGHARDEEPAGAGPARDSSGIRRADVAGLHITLVFLGATPAGQIALLHERVRSLARTLSAFAYALAGPRLFPDARRPRVVALEPLDPAGFLAWQAPLAGACAELGFARESRAYRPHLSLARIRRAPARPFEPLAVPLAGQASEIVLYESRAGRYNPLFRQPCGRAERCA